MICWSSFECNIKSDYLKPVITLSEHAINLKRLMSEQKQLKYDKAYLRMAIQWGKLSHCKRKQVGALIVKDSMIISDGYNGTPTGFDNCCEDENGKTRWYVLHAEATDPLLHD